MHRSLAMKTFYWSFTGMEYLLISWWQNPFIQWFFLCTQIFRWNHRQRMPNSSNCSFFYWIKKWQYLNYASCVKCFICIIYKNINSQLTWNSIDLKLTWKFVQILNFQNLGFNIDIWLPVSCVFNYVQFINSLSKQLVMFLRLSSDTFPQTAKNLISCGAP